MNMQELRLECLKLALPQIPAGSSIDANKTVKDAESFIRFVLDQTPAQLCDSDGKA
jgi:hypothetical protein